MTYSELLRYGRRRLAAAGLDDPARDARLLLCAAAGFDMAFFYLRQGEVAADGVRERYQCFLERRALREPVQYIIGEWEFMGLPFIVSPDTLIPRPDTEILVETVVDFLNNPDNTNPHLQSPLCHEPESSLVLDLCTGGGCVAVSVASLCRGVSVTATDISSAALDIARQNAARNGVADRVDFMRGDLFEALGPYPPARRFDVICANPPYIPRKELPALMADVREYEPALALDGGPDGLDFYGRIADGAAAYLRPGGLLAVEVGAGQADRVASIFARHPFADIRVARDLSGIERVVYSLSSISAIKQRRRD